MALLALCLIVVVVAALTVLSRRSGMPDRGCCATADPHPDLRMRDPFADPGPT